MDLGLGHLRPSSPALWAGRASAAIVATEGTATVRGQAWIARESLAEGLTANRDGLRPWPPA